MPKLTKKAIRLWRTDVRTDPNYRKASLLEKKYFFSSQNINSYSMKVKDRYLTGGTFRVFTPLFVVFSLF